jgi:1-deoxy-D-xylulose-5-phosphate synthase
VLSAEGVTTPFSLHGIPQEFLQHAERKAVLDRIGLNAQTIARGIVERLAAEGHEPLPISEKATRD